MINAGWERVKDSEYHAMPHMSSHMLMKFMRSPRHYIEAKKNPREPTPAMRFGTLVHSLTLEPENIIEKITYEPDVDRRTKIGKEFFAEWNANLQKGDVVVAKGERSYDLQRSLGEDYLVVTHDKLESAKAMADRVRNSYAFQCYEDSDPAYEMCGFCEIVTPGGTVQLRCKPDIRLKKIPIFCDLKTTEDARVDKFRWSIKNYDYLLQLAFYQLVIETIEGRGHEAQILAIETEAPYEMVCYDIPQVLLDYERQRIFSALSQFAVCEATNTWPGYPEVPITLDLQTTR